MKLLAFLLIVLLGISFKVNAYPQDQLQECINSSIQNPSVKGVSEESIEKYCDCALNLIVNEGKDIRSSGYRCASKYFK